MRQLIRLLPFIVITLLAAAFFGVLAVGVLVTLAILVPVAVLTLRLIVRFKPDLIRPKPDATGTVIETDYKVERVEDDKRR